MHATHHTMLISMSFLVLVAAVLLAAAPPNDGASPPSAAPGAPGSTKPANPPPAAPPKAKDDVLAVEIDTLEGKPANLRQHRGKVLLIVNVASKCGYTPQYAKLERLHQKYKDRGLVIIGVPSNDFGGQEPGSSQEIRDFCTKNYGVTFPLMAKSQTKAGDEQSELYRVLEARTGKLPTWNFCKYIVTRDGKEITFHAQSVEPDSEPFVKELEAALDQSAPTGG